MMVAAGIYLSFSRLRLAVKRLLSDLFMENCVTDYLIVLLSTLLYCYNGSKMDAKRELHFCNSLFVVPPENEFLF